MLSYWSISHVAPSTDGGDSPVLEEKPASQEEVGGEGSEADEDSQSQFTQSSTPMLSSTNYNKYIRSLIKLLIGEETLNNWLKQGWCIDFFIRWFSLEERMIFWCAENDLLSLDCKLLLS